MPFDPENQFVPTDPAQGLPTHPPLRITVYAHPPPSDGIDDWIGPGTDPDGGPDDWFVPPRHSAARPFLPTRAPAISSRRPAGPITPPYKEGTFSFSDWTGYPAYAPKPKGPFRLRQGEEYQTARDAADRVNKKTRNADPARYVGIEIHEVHPVKFGGHPTDPANKIVLPIKEHRMVNTPPPERRWLRVTA